MPFNTPRNGIYLSPSSPSGPAPLGTAPVPLSPWGPGGGRAPRLPHGTALAAGPGAHHGRCR